MTYASAQPQAKSTRPPVGERLNCSPHRGTLAFGHHEGRMPTHGYEATREAAMAAFAKSWRRKCQSICKQDDQASSTTA
jgi:hypothetical protein